MISHNKEPAVWDLKRHFNITVTERFFKDIRLIQHYIVDVNRSVLFYIYPITGTAYYALYKYLIIIIERSVKNNIVRAAFSQPGKNARSSAAMY